MNVRGRQIIVIGLVVLLSSVIVPFMPMDAAGIELPGYANLTGSAESGPGWTDLFDETGKVKGLFGGHSAAFIEDNISADVATDMSVLSGDGHVINGTVQGINDLGNAYAYRTTDVDGNLVLFAGVERLEVNERSSYIDIEFTQDKIQVWSGVPWEIHGQRTIGDLIVRINLVAGAVHNVDFKYYAEEGAGGYQILETAWSTDGQPCNISNDIYAFCSGQTPAGLLATNSDVWNLWGTPVAVPVADSFVTVGVNVGRLLGFNPDYSGLTLRTPEDIAFGTGLLVMKGGVR